MTSSQEKEKKPTKDDYVSSTSHDQDREYYKDQSKTAQLYNCTFCKRGFTTAQALGGHMNIHRKDRARTQTSSTFSGDVQRRNELSLFPDKPSSETGVSGDQGRSTQDEELDLTLRLGHDL